MNLWTNKKKTWGIYISAVVFWNVVTLISSDSFRESGRVAKSPQALSVTSHIHANTTVFHTFATERVKALKRSRSASVVFIHLTHKVCSWWRVSGEGLDNVLGLLQCRKVDRQIYMQGTPKHAALHKTHKFAYHESRTEGWLHSFHLSCVCLCSQWLVCVHIWFLCWSQL